MTNELHAVFAGFRKNQSVEMKIQTGDGARILEFDGRSAGNDGRPGVFTIDDGELQRRLATAIGQ